MIWHWFLTVTGSNNTSGTWYGFWSGFGSDLMEFTVLGVLYRKLNCHEPGCWRIGLHHHKHLVLCKKHHPLMKGKK